MHEKNSVFTWLILTIGKLSFYAPIIIFTTIISLSLYFHISLNYGEEKVVEEYQMPSIQFCNYIQTEGMSFFKLYLTNIYGCRSIYEVNDNWVYINAYNRTRSGFPHDMRETKSDGRSPKKLIYTNENTYSKELDNGLSVTFYQYDCYFETGKFDDRNTKFEFWVDDIYHYGVFYASREYDEDLEFNTFSYQESEVTDLLRELFPA